VDPIGTKEARSMAIAGPRRLAVLAGALACGLMAFAGPARAARRKAYPTTTCVAAKQAAAARYCGRALRAWAKWEASQDDARRAAALAAAAGDLAEAWSRAEDKAEGQGAECADTTLAASAAAGLIDSAAGAIVGEINAGFDLDDGRHRRCGAKLVSAAAARCAALLAAEAGYLAKEGRPSAARKRESARNRAAHRFGVAWTRITTGPCPTGGTPTDVADLVDRATAAVVRDTTASPNVDDAGFTVVSPAGPVSYEGREFQAVCMDGSPYHFFARRGSVNRLVMYYQGGGACWEQLTCSVPSCDATVDLTDDNPARFTSGFGDGTNPANPFRDWHVVFVSYCSCDIHFGDAAQDYPLHVEHRGYQNAKIVEKWAREHFVNPEVVFVTGSSAGAYGAWFHAPLLHEVWPAAQFHVLADAGNGVVTQDFLETYFPNWNFRANLPPGFPEIVDVLDQGTGIPGYTEAVAGIFPDTNWAHYTTAFDGGFGGQTSFYNIMLNDNQPPFALLWWQGSCAFNQVMRMQAIATAEAVPGNYRYYIGTGSRHTMWGSNKVYGDTTGGVPTIVDWVTAMLASAPGAPDPGWTNVECTNCGLTLPGDPRPDPLAPPFAAAGDDVVITCPGTP
jgi:hypothetical protein